MSLTSNEFAALVDELHRFPNNPALQKAIVQSLPNMIAKAGEKPIDLFRLAHIYPPTSSQYKQTMRQAANLGCTNAMLVMMQVFGNSNNAADLNKAAHYFMMINKSEDSYIKAQAKLVLDKYPQLAKTIQEQAKPHFCSTHRFFASIQEIEKTVELEDIHCCANQGL